MILQEIAEKTVERINNLKSTKPLSDIKSYIRDMEKTEDFRFEKALKNNDIAFICEVKKASPSKGIIAEDFPYVDIAKDYENAGASAISVLTEPYYFKGDNLYLKEISENVNIPLLRKDFTVDEYMIYEAKQIGASAVLLICSLLSKSQLKEYIDIADELGLSALVEAHDEDEIAMANDAKARIIGVNNRDLKTFTVDVNNSIKLRKFVPKDTIYVSESGIKTPEDIERLRQNDVNAVLIGETLMRSNNKKEELDILRGKC